MKYYLSLIALIIVSLFISSGFAASSSSVAIGATAPNITLKSDSADFSLEEARGSMVLITFWSVADAASRRDCNAYAAALKDTEIQHIAVNLDNNSTLYKEIATAPAFSSTLLFSPDEFSASQIAKSYGLNGHFGSVLISPQGKIIAFNPAVSNVKKL